MNNNNYDYSNDDYNGNNYDDCNDSNNKGNDNDNFIFSKNLVFCQKTKQKNWNGLVSERLFHTAVNQKMQPG